MFIIDTPVPRVPGLRGSDKARAQNLDLTGPYNPIGGQPLFGSGSGAGSAGSPGGYEAGCVGPEYTGTSGGGDGSPGNSMTALSLNHCYQSSGPKHRPDFCTKKCKCGAGGSGAGPGSGPGSAGPFAGAGGAL